MQAMAAEGITYNLDQMDSDIVSRLKTPDGPLVLLPYPVVTVDMGCRSEMTSQLHGSEHIEKVQSPCCSLEPERQGVSAHK
jgi:hypothetical protein